MDVIAECFRLSSGLGSTFEARYLTPLWNRYPSSESSEWQAVAMFLEGYASERQGTRPDYGHAAADTIQELERRNQPLAATQTADVAWRIYQDRLHNRNLNYANNPLCPQGTAYERGRQRTQGKTNQRSVIEFLRDVSEAGGQSNIVWLAQSAIESECVQQAHSDLQEINGVGPKIASLFLRDTTIRYRLSPAKHRHLLQPVDTWIRRTWEVMTGQHGSSPDDNQRAQRWVVENSLRFGLMPEMVNAGMWYFGSQVAGSEYRLSRALKEPTYARQLIRGRREAVRKEAHGLNALPAGQ